VDELKNGQDIKDPNIIKIGIGPDSWGVWFPDYPDQVPWQQFLDEVVEAGYEWIEAGPLGYLPSNPAILRKELDSRGLNIVATTVMDGHLENPDDWPRIEKQLLKAGELGANMDAKYLVLIDDAYLDLDSGERICSSTLDHYEWDILIDSINRVATIAKEKFGLPVTVHPNAETHLETEFHLELLLDQTDPKLVSLCVDTGHLAYTGGDPVSFINKYHDRVSYLHLKDVDALILEDVRKNNLPMVRATEMGVFQEPPGGVVDFEKLAQVLGDIKYNGWAIVEQDMYKPALDVPLPIAKRTREYLRNVGIG